MTIRRVERAPTTTLSVRIDTDTKKRPEARALKTLEHAGLIQMTRGRIQIIDVEALEGWSESATGVLHSVPRTESLRAPA